MSDSAPPPTDPAADPAAGPEPVAGAVPDPARAAPQPGPTPYPDGGRSHPVARGNVALLVAGALLLGGFVGGVAGLGVGFVAGHHVGVDRHRMWMDGRGGPGGPLGPRYHRFGMEGPPHGWASPRPGPTAGPTAGGDG